MSSEMTRYSFVGCFERLAFISFSVVVKSFKSLWGFGMPKTGMFYPFMLNQRALMSSIIYSRFSLSKR